MKPAGAAAGVAVLAILAACGSGKPSANPVGVLKAVAAPLPPHPGSHYLYQLNDVACQSVAHCVGTGSVDFSGVLLVENGGKWTLTEPPVPRNLGPGAKRGIRMGSASCPAVGQCVALGDASSGAQSEPLVFTEQASGWRETILPLPPGAKGGGLSLVSWPSVANCTAAGYYTPRSHTDRARQLKGLLVTERNGTWGSPVTADLPSDAGSVSEGAGPEIAALSCSSPRNCTAVGSYGDSFGALRAGC